MPQRARRARKGDGEINTYWRSLTDEQLLRVSFTTTDPEGLEGLVLDVPPDNGYPPIVELCYDFRGSKRSYIRCAHCGYPNHLAGYVIKVDERVRFLVGHDCGDKIYGADFAGLRSDYESARSHADDLRRWLGLQSEFAAFFDYLKRLQCCPEVRAFRDKRATFRKAHPRLFGGLSIASARYGGALHIDEKVRDFDAEVRAEERYERELADWNKLSPAEQKKRRREGRKPVAPQPPFYKNIPKVVMTIRAREFFSDATLPHETLSSILRAFENLSAEIDTATLRNAVWQNRNQNASNGMLGRSPLITTYREIFKQANTFLDQIEIQLSAIENFVSFFDPIILAAVAQWANTHPGISANVLVRGRGLVDGSDPTLAVSLPADFSPPDRKPLVSFRRAVNGLDTSL